MEGSHQSSDPSSAPTAVIGWRFGQLTTGLFGQALNDEIAAIWKEADMVVVSQADVLADDRPSEVHGVPMPALKERIGAGRGGAGDIPQWLLELYVTLWPLASSGYVGAMSADAWEYSKKGIKVALRELFHRKATKVTIDAADDSVEGAFNDDAYVFEPDDLGDLDHIVDQLVANVIARGSIEIRTTKTTYNWSADLQTRVPEERVDTVQRVTR